MPTDNGIPKKFRAFIINDSARAMDYVFVKKRFVNKGVA